MFIQPTGIPETVVWAVYRIAHNQGTDHDWDMLDKATDERGAEAVLDDIIDILRINGETDLEGERRWWHRQLVEDRLAEMVQ